MTLYKNASVILSLKALDEIAVQLDEFVSGLQRRVVHESAQFQGDLMPQPEQKKPKVD
jgi:hypothetical protein